MSAGRTGWRPAPAAGPEQVSVERTPPVACRPPVTVYIASLYPTPGAPMLDAESSDQLAELVAKGAGGTLFLETDDCQASYDDLAARGVVLNDPPTPQPYGIDTSFRDPSGNNIRLTQVLDFSMDRR